MSATLRTGENNKVSIGKVESQEWFRTNLVQQLNLTIRGKIPFCKTYGRASQSGGWDYRGRW